MDLNYSSSSMTQILAMSAEPMSDSERRLSQALEINSLHDLMPAQRRAVLQIQKVLDNLEEAQVGALMNALAAARSVKVTDKQMEDIRWANLEASLAAGSIPAATSGQDIAL